MRRYHLKQGDRSSAGGVVLEGDPTSTHHGTAMTYLGAKVYCHTCKTVGFIVGQGPRLPDRMMGGEAALDGDTCACKCEPSPVMIASQTNSFQTLDSRALARASRQDQTSLQQDTPVPRPPQWHSQRVFVSDSTTGEPLRNQRFVADIEGDQQLGRRSLIAYAAAA